MSGTVDVNVVNGPLAVVDAGVADTPVNYSFFCTTSALGCGPAVGYQVPAGYRLVIEYASVRAADLPAGDAAFLEISTMASGSIATFLLPPPPIVLGGRSFQGQVVKIYADPTSYISLTALRASGVGGVSDTRYTMSFSGHLVPVD